MGLKVVDTLLYQDNLSSISLEKNGRASSGKRTRHIDIRYFFVKDRLQSEGIKIHHCPTELMVADFFTKPLQGGLFSKFRDVILGYTHTASLSPDPPHVTEERVGNDSVQFTQEVTEDTETEEHEEPSTDGEWHTVIKKKKYKSVPFTRVLKNESATN